jgi:hypothetical protein
MPKAVFANNVKTSFVSLNAGSTTLAVTSDAAFPTISGGDYFYLTLYNVVGSAEQNIEIVKVTAKVTSNVYTIVRGQEGTTDVAHLSSYDNYAGLRLTAGVATRFIQSDTGTINNDNWSGTDLSIANGGTGTSTAQNAINALVSTYVSGTYLRGNGTNAVMGAIQASDVPTLNQNTTGTAANVSGTVAIGNGGTGATTQAAAFTAIAGSATSGTFARGNGTNVVMAAIQASDVPTLNQNTTGNAANVTGTVVINNGGTGASTKLAAFNALSPMTALGDTDYHNGTDSVKLAGNTTTTKKWLGQTGNGTISAAPAWDAIANADVPSALTGKTYNALSLTAATTGFTIAGGTTSKTLTVNNTLGLSGTDSSTLNIGAGGTLGTAAFTASSAYEPAITTLANTKGGTGQNSSSWTGLAKVAAGVWSAGVSGTDYAPATSGTSILYGNNAGGFSNVTVSTGLSFNTGTLTNSLPMAYPAGNGIAVVSGGNSWATSLTAPNGAIVGTTDSQTLTNKTLTTPIISSITNTGTLTLPTSTDTLVARATTDTLTNKTLTGTKETVATITDAAAFEINPANGGIQTITLTANRTPKGTNFTAGQSVTLMVTAGAFTLTWTDTTFGPSGVKFVGISGPGTYPALSTSAISIIELWEVGTQVYGAFVGIA